MIKSGFLKAERLAARTGAYLKYLESCHLTTFFGGCVLQNSYKPIEPHFEATLPNSYHIPTQSPKPFGTSSVPDHVSLNLWDPIGEIRVGPTSLATNMALPKTAVYKGDHTQPGENEIRFSAEVLTVEPV